MVKDIFWKKAANGAAKKTEAMLPDIVRVLRLVGTKDSAEIEEAISRTFKKHGVKDADGLVAHSAAAQAEALIGSLADTKRTLSTTSLMLAEVRKDLDEPPKVKGAKARPRSVNVKEFMKP